MVKIGIGIIFTFVSCTKNAGKNVTQQEQQNVATPEMMSENGANPDETIMTTLSAGNTGLTEVNSEDGSGNHQGEKGSHHGHFLYAESNAAANNQVMVYEIGAGGLLHLNGTTSSGGAGTGVGLGSQGALTLDEDHELLFAVNAGSNSVSSFKVRSDGSLELAHTENSGGTTPVSLSVHEGLLYVLNFGSDNIHGFRIGEEGTLTHIVGSTQALSGTGVVAPQISFTPNGDWLIVTEKATNNISSFKVKDNGSIWPAVVTPSTGQTPFGFDFGRDDFMIVSNAAGGAAGAGSATSYRIGGNGVPHAINGAVPNNQAAPCWVAVTKYGRFAFLTNTASNSISSYYVSPGGYLFLVHQVAATTDNAPIDIVVAKNNYFVYALNSKSGTIGEYHRTFLGGLESMGTVSGLPVPVTGLTTY